MVLESLGEEMLDLIKDLITKSMAFGRNAKSKKYVHGGFEIKRGNGRKKENVFGASSYQKIDDKTKGNHTRIYKATGAQGSRV